MNKAQSIPEVLYHGTSFTRWILIQRHGLRGDAPRIYEPHPKHPKNYMAEGYVYLTGNERSAEFYACKVTEAEHRLAPEEKKKFGIADEVYEPVVLTVETKGLKGIEVDPEARSGESWFRFRGTIPTRHIVKVKGIIPLDRQQDPEFKDAIDYELKLSDAYGEYDAKKYAASLLTAKPEYPTWKQFYLDWMKKYDNDFYKLVVAELALLESNLNS